MKPDKDIAYVSATEPSSMLITRLFQVEQCSGTWNEIIQIEIDTVRKLLAWNQIQHKGTLLVQPQFTIVKGASQIPSIVKSQRYHGQGFQLNQLSTNRDGVEATNLEARVPRPGLLDHHPGQQIHHRTKEYHKQHAITQSS
jgi:hypothetical protein